MGKLLLCALPGGIQGWVDEKHISRPPKEAPKKMNPYEPGYRPRCLVCLEELLPCISQNDGQSCYRGFNPCPDHPHGGVMYKDGTVPSAAVFIKEEVTGSPPAPAIAVTMHPLKTIPRYFVPAWAGIKRFEVRMNDRNFRAGDNIILREFDPKRPCKERSPQVHSLSDCSCKFTGRQIRGRINFVLTGEDAMVYIPWGGGIQSGWCVFGWQAIERQFMP